MKDQLKIGARVFAPHTDIFYGTKDESPHDPAMTPEQAKQFIIELAKIQRMPQNAYIYSLFHALYVGQTLPENNSISKRRPHALR